jgi:endoglucanase
MRFQRKGVVAAGAAVALLTIGSLLASAAQAGTTATNGATATISGSTATIKSNFTNTTTLSKVLVDTEVYNSSNTRVAQWAHNVDLAKGKTLTDVLSWDITGLPTGSYKVRQGMFKPDWQSQIAWSNDAGTIQIAKAVTTTTTAAGNWVVGASTTLSGMNATVRSTFTAPAAGTYLYDTEVIDALGTRVGQWTRTSAIRAGQTLIFDDNWTAPVAANYVVKIGVFTTDWSRTVIWQDSAATIALAPATTTTTTTAAPTTTTTTAAPTTTTTTAPAPPSSSNPLAGSTFYGANPGAQAQAAAWAGSRPADAALMQRMADTPTSAWIGDWSGNPETVAGNIVAAAGNKVPVITLYNIPGRDCGNFSAGGAGSETAYKAWIDGVGRGLGNAKAVVVVEPDTLSQLCDDPSARFRMLNYAVDVLTANTNALVYLDAGNPGWIAADVMAERLKSSGVQKARGFAINVSNFKTTADSVAYGDAISALTGGSHYVVDTSRNGNGSNGEWCNPAGRALGQAPTTTTASKYADAYLWIKIVGESDGNCNGGPNAGTWWGDYALGLAQRAWN